MPAAGRSTAAIRRNVVLLRLSGCGLQFGSLTTDELAAHLKLPPGLKLDGSIRTQNARLVIFRCNSMQLKNRLLKWDVRSSATRKGIVLNEDLLASERAQKASLRSAMKVLWEAGWKPTWHRATVAWKYDQKWFTLTSTDVPANGDSNCILQIARTKCGMLLSTDGPAKQDLSLQPFVDGPAKQADILPLNPALLNNLPEEVQAEVLRFADAVMLDMQQEIQQQQQEIQEHMHEQNARVNAALAAAEEKTDKLVKVNQSLFNRCKELTKELNSFKQPTDLCTTAQQIVACN